jgi:predicted esterase
MKTLPIPARVSGRVLVANEERTDRALVGFHGYGQNAAIMLEELRRIPGAEAWRLVSVQALHRFYTRGDQAVVASWMTREDREQAISDNIFYVDRAVSAALSDISVSTQAGTSATVVYLGFSQGASMAARAATRGADAAAGLVMLGGDIPPDVREAADARWPPALIGCGDRDEWYGARVESDLAFLRARGVPHEGVRFAGGHEFTDEFRDAVGRFLIRVAASGSRRS